MPRSTCGGSREGRKRWGVAILHYCKPTPCLVAPTLWYPLPVEGPTAVGELAKFRPPTKNVNDSICSDLGEPALIKPFLLESDYGAAGHRKFTNIGGGRVNEISCFLKGMHWSNAVHVLKQQLAPSKQPKRWGITSQPRWLEMWHKHFGAALDLLRGLLGASWPLKITTTMVWWLGRNWASIKLDPW